MTLQLFAKLCAFSQAWLILFKLTSLLAWDWWLVLAPAWVAFLGFFYEAGTFALRARRLTSMAKGARK